jgi:hypothetical protein
MADKKTQMEKIREAYVKAQADKGEDRVTQADMEAAKKFLKNKKPPKSSKPVYLPDAVRPFTKQIGRNTFEVNPNKYDETGNLRKKDMGDDLPMSKEGSPTVTDTETGKVTYGKPEKFEHGGMASCRGMGKAIKGGKFIGVK